MKIRVIIFTLTMVGIMGYMVEDCSCQKTEPVFVKEDSDMQISSAKNENTIYNFSGKKDEVEKQIKGFEEAKKLIDPAFNIVLEAEQYYDKGQYEKSLELTKDALEKAKSDITRRAAYRNLLGIYEATKRYDLAIQSIDWLLEHVNEYAKPDLLKKRAQLEKILLGSGKNHS